MLFNLIEHVENPGAILEKCEKLLTPDGILVIQTPNIDSLDHTLFRNGHWGGYHCPRHWILFNRPSFETLLSKCRLKIDQFKYIQGAHFWSVSLLHIFWKLKLIRAGKKRALSAHPLYFPLAAFFAGVDILRGLFMKGSQMVLVCKKQS